MTDLTPRGTVAELDRYIIGQSDAKRAVAVALRNRWRRQQLPEDMREEVYPKNILMAGPTGVGKTEIARRLARLANAPFFKVEATKFTEVGYVGRDVESIIRDLVETAIQQARERRRLQVRPTAEYQAENRVLDVLVGAQTRGESRRSALEMLRNGDFDEREVELDVSDSSGSFPGLELPPGVGGVGGVGGMINLGDIMGKAFGPKTRKQRMTVRDAIETATQEEADKLIDEDQLTREAMRSVENDGIVFLDEIDKLCHRTERIGGEPSREGVQRDLLPLIEGTTVATRHGAVRTDHILFIASGAFHEAKPRDLLPELQGRLPIRVELAALTREDFARILVEPDYSLTAQYKALLGTERVEVEFAEDGIDAIASIAAELNQSVENIGARRLHTVLERLLDEVSFHAPDMGGGRVLVDRAFVESQLESMRADTDVGRYIL